MNNKMTTNSQLSTTESKKQKQNKANKQDRNRITDVGTMGRVISWEGEGGEWGKRYRE